MYYLMKMLLDILRTVARQIALRDVYKNMTTDQKDQILSAGTYVEKKKIAQKIVQEKYPWLKLS